MSQVNILLRCYYETLYELLEEKKNILINRIRAVLGEQLKAGCYENFNRETFDAYWEACMAFIEERIETYNPIGIQYMYGGDRRDEAFKMELQLDWFDSRKEFQNLVEAARIKADYMTSDDDLREKARELIQEAGAFPDKSIIAGYRAKPELKKLPDYVVALIIEENIRESENDEQPE
ncbi:MAG: hypothetical protein JW787_15435 [Sedimentisphaerales bacterium]|nr:hypothetical protein [Sedimentisphaerales bacterium]